MTAPSLTDTRAQAGDLRPLRKSMRGWRLAVIATAATGAVTGLGWAWNWLTSGQVVILLVITVPCIVAGLFWPLLSNDARDRTAEEPTGMSGWETRLRPHFPRDERPETEHTRQSQGGEA